MRIFNLIRDKIKKSNSKAHKMTPNSVSEAVLTEYLDGMGTATARILINKRLSGKFIKKYGLKDLKNMGRAFAAKLGISWRVDGCFFRVDYRLSYSSCGGS